MSPESDASSPEETRGSQRVRASAAKENEFTHYGRVATWMIARGLWSVIFGIVVVFWPRVQIDSPFNTAVGVRTAALLILAYIVVQALMLLGQAAKTPALRTQLLGQAVVVLPAAGFLLFASEAGAVRAAIMVWALLHGLLEAWIYLRVKHQRMSTDFAIAAAVHLLLAIAMIAGSNMKALSEMGLTGAAATIIGVVYAVGGFTRNNRKNTGAISEDGE